MKQGKVPNTHRVPAKLWRKFSDHGKIAFNEIYSTVNSNRSVYCATDLFPVKGKDKENVNKILDASIFNICIEAAAHISNFTLIVTT